MSQNPALGDRPTYRLYILFLLLAVNALSHADRHVFSVLIPSIKGEFGASDSLMGLIGGPGFIVSYVLFSLPLARLADRWSRRGVLALSAMLWSAATAACGASASLLQVAFARLIVGVGEAGSLPPSQSIISSLYDERRRSGAMGVLASATYIGVVIGLMGGAVVAQIWGWRGAFFVLALPGFPLAILLWLTGPRRVKVTVTTQVAQPQESMIAAIRRFWAIRSLRMLAIGVGVFNIFGYAGAIWKPAFLVRSHGMTLLEAGTWMGLGAAIGGIAGAMMSGVVVDRLRPRGEVWQLRVPAIAFFLACPVCLIIFLLPRSVGIEVGGFVIPGVALLSIVASFLSAFWAGPSFAAAARLVPTQQRAQVVAMLVIVINVIGSACGPLIAGMVSDLLTAYFGTEALRVSLLTMSVLPTVGGFLFWHAAGYYVEDLRDARLAGTQ